MRRFWKKGRIFVVGVIVLWLGGVLYCSHLRQQIINVATTQSMRVLGSRIDVQDVSLKFWEHRVELHHLIVRNHSGYISKDMIVIPDMRLDYRMSDLLLGRLSHIEGITISNMSLYYDWQDSGSNFDKTFNLIDHYPSFGKDKINFEVNHVQLIGGHIYFSFPFLSRVPHLTYDMPALDQKNFFKATSTSYQVVLKNFLDQSLTLINGMMLKRLSIAHDKYDHLSPHEQKLLNKFLNDMNIDDD